MFNVNVNVGDRSAIDLQLNTSTTGGNGNSGGGCGGGGGVGGGGANNSILSAGGGVIPQGLGADPNHDPNSVIKLQVWTKGNELLAWPGDCTVLESITRGEYWSHVGRQGSVLRHML